MAQINDSLSTLGEFDDSISQALEESDIDLLRRFNERKLLVNTLNSDQHIKDLQNLNVAVYGLASGPPPAASGKLSKKAAAEQANFEE